MERHVVPIVGDGNCLFPSVTYYLFNNDQHHREIRMQVVEKITNEWGYYEGFIIGDPSYRLPITNSAEYENLLSLDGEFGGHVELYGIRQLFPDHLFRVYRAAAFGSKTFLFRLDGAVPGEEFNYYKILHPGNLLLILESHEGDADVYVSEKNPTPTYHPETYDLQSATCGTDAVFVPKNLKRPIAIGIYGHFVHEHSKFTLQVYQMPDTEDYFSSDAEENHKNGETSEIINGMMDKKDGKKVTPARTKRKLRNVPNSLWPFLELFEMLFL